MTSCLQLVKSELLQNKAARAKLAETDPEKFAQLEKRDALEKAHKIAEARPLFAVD